MGRVYEFKGSRFISKGYREMAQLGRHMTTVDNSDEERVHRGHRVLHNIEMMTRYEKYINDIWIQRGIDLGKVFDDQKESMDSASVQEVS